MVAADGPASASLNAGGGGWWRAGMESARDRRAGMLTERRWGRRRRPRSRRQECMKQRHPPSGRHRRVARARSECQRASLRCSGADFCGGRAPRWQLVAARRRRRYASAVAWSRTAAARRSRATRGPAQYAPEGPHDTYSSTQMGSPVCAFPLATWPIRASRLEHSELTNCPRYANPRSGAQRTTVCSNTCPFASDRNVARAGAPPLRVAVGHLCNMSNTTGAATRGASAVRQHPCVIGTSPASRAPPDLLV